MGEMGDPDQRLAQVRAYHERTKHRLQRYAAGPETLDWDAQPDPFRRYLGTELTLLPLVADQLDAPWHALFEPGRIPPQPFDRRSLGALLELSFGLAAWKQAGPDRWAVRCNPSSGNLHPTEAWLLLQGAGDPTSELADGLHHYAPREHGLELRAAIRPQPAGSTARAFVALSSIHWREAWKYGERAFRYCQLDIGHALGALRYAAALQGWQLREVLIGTEALAHLLGLDRDLDYGRAEREDADLLLELLPADAPLPAPAAAPLDLTAQATWFGQANVLDRRPMYRWPVIGAVASASVLPPDVAHDTPTTSVAPVPAMPTAPGTPDTTSRRDEPAATLIRQRRSAQRFDSRARAPLAQLRPLLEALQSPRLPLDLPTAQAGRIHVLMFAHRIDGLAPGAYLLPRRAEAEPLLRASLSPGLAWQPVELPADPASGTAPLRLLQLADNPALAGTLRTINCHQALGSDAITAFALLAEFDPVLDSAPWRYRRLFHEAGLIGQVLYMEAEAAGLAGTGIGCYFDDTLHELIGLRAGLSGNLPLQSLYHFTVGVRLTDARIGSEPPYPFNPDRPQP